METIRQHPSDVEYHEAFASLRAAKNWFWWLLLAAMLVNLATFAAVRFYRVLDESPSFQQDLASIRGTQPVNSSAMPAGLPQPMTMPASQPASEPTTAATAEPTTRSAFAVRPPQSPKAQWQEEVYQNLSWVLPLAKAMGILMSVLLAMSLMTSLSISLSGRLGGAGYLASAFVWSIVLVALFVPWSQAFTGVPVPGVLFARAELIQSTAQMAWGAPEASLREQVIYYARFAGYPILSLLILLTVQVKYARGFREVAVETESK